MAKDKSLEIEVRRALEPAVDRLVAEMTSTLRVVVEARLREFLREPGRGRARGFNGSPRRKTKLDMACIAPGCANRSKGPRFKYLCDEHKGQSEKLIAQWRAARKDGAAAPDGARSAQKRS
jgi:hypothetical protein